MACTSFLLIPMAREQNLAGQPRTVSLETVLSVERKLIVVVADCAPEDFDEHELVDTDTTTNRSAIILRIQGPYQ